jgi:mannosyltransferase
VTGDISARDARLWLVLVLCVSAFLSFFALGRQSFWLDEIYSYAFATAPISEFWQTMANGDANMVVYYVLLRAWMLAGDTESWIRSLSAFMVLASVAAVYVLGAQLVGRRVGVVAAFLLAINPFVVAYAQEARAYSLSLLLTLCATILFIRALERSSAFDWVAYVLVAALAVYSHLFASLTLLAHGVSLLAWPFSRVPWKRLLLAGVAVGALLSPMAIVVMTSEGKLGWVSKPGLRQVAGVFASMAGGKWLLIPYAALSAAALLAGGREAPGERSGRRWHDVLLTALLVLPVAVAFAVSLVKPVFVDRFFIAGVAPLAILAASGLDRMQSTRMRVVMLSIIVGLTIPQLVSHYGSEKENWRGVVAHLTAHAGERDAVVFYTATGRHAFAYYRKQQASGRVQPTVAVPSRAMRAAGGLELRRAFVQDLARAHDRVWLVLSHVDVGERRAVSRSLEELLGELYRSSSEWHFKGVRIVVYPADAVAARPLISEKVPLTVDRP